MIPGEYILAEGDVIANAGRREIELEVANTGDRPIQVGSHFHFFEVNRALRFDRGAAFGMRLNIPAGTAVRFEPGDSKKVTLVEIGGSKHRVWPEWFDERPRGRIDEAARAEARCRAGILEMSAGARSATRQMPQRVIAKNKPMSLKIPRRQYADLYGPTTGDRVRLADTDLFIEIEKDLTTPGDEAKFGGGKVDSRRHGAIVDGDWRRTACSIW